jgi:hypothetical protein
VCAKLGVQSRELFLDQVLGGFALAHEAHRVIQERRFEVNKQVLNRFGRLRARFVWLTH